MNKYKAYLFDADNTLFDFDKAEEESINTVLTDLNLDLSLSSEYHRINHELWEQFNEGKIKREELLVKRFRILFKNLNYDEIQIQKISDIYLYNLSNKAYLIPFAFDLCNELNKMGKTLYLITNGNKKVQENRLNKSEITKLFSEVFISEVIGYEKPNSGFFDYVFERIPFNKSECLIVGDSLSSDITGGIRNGIDTCFYNPGKKEIPQNKKPTYNVNSLKDILLI